MKGKQWELIWMIWIYTTRYCCNWTLVVAYWLPLTLSSSIDIILHTNIRKHHIHAATILQGHGCDKNTIISGCAKSKET